MSSRREMAKEEMSDWQPPQDRRRGRLRKSWSQVISTEVNSRNLQDKERIVGIDGNSVAANYGWKDENDLSLYGTKASINIFFLRDKE